MIPRMIAVCVLTLGMASGAFAATGTNNGKTASSPGVSDTRGDSESVDTNTTGSISPERHGESQDCNAMRGRMARLNPGQKSHIEDCYY